MKFFLFMLCWASACGSALAQSWPSLIQLGSQAQVDSFPLIYGPVEVLPTDLIIGSGDSLQPSNIYDLSPLSSLRYIVGALVLIHNPLLQSMHGLEALEKVEYNLAIVDNPQLLDMHGLEGLREVNDKMYIEENAGLRHLTGLDSLRKVAYDIFITGNDQLRDLRGLGRIKYGPSITLIDNDHLESLVGMDSLYQSTGLEISSNATLKNLQGMNRLRTTLSIIVRDNDSLEHISGFPSLQNVTLNLAVENNPRLVDLVGFGAPGPLALGGLFVRDNPRLRNLQGLQRIKEIAGGGAASQLYIERNDSLQSLRGLDVERIGASQNYLKAEVHIRSNPLLTELALDSLRVVGHPTQAANNHLEIRDNRSLKALNGLTSLDSCHALLSISENDSLQVVDLPTLRYGYSLTISIDSVEESRVGPFDRLEYVEMSLGVYDATYVQEFSNLKRVWGLNVRSWAGSVRGFNQLKEAKNGIGIFGYPYMVDGFHGIIKCGGVVIANLRDTLRGFEQLDSLDNASAYHTAASLGFHVYDQCYYDSAFAKLSYIKGQFFSLHANVPIHTGNYLPRLPALKKIGYRMSIYDNPDGLRGLGNFPQLTHIGPPTYSSSSYSSGLVVFNNGHLQSLNGLEYLNKITGVIQIYDNDSLADCSALCPVLQHAVISGPVTIHDNPFPCSSKPEVLAWCDTAYVSASRSPAGLAFALWPNPATSEVQVQLPEGSIQTCTVSLSDLSGRMLWQAEASGILPEFILPSLPAGIYLFKVQSGGQQGWRRLVLLPR